MCYQALPCVTKRYQALLSVYHALPMRYTKRYQALPCVTKRYQALPSVKKLLPALPTVAKR